MHNRKDLARRVEVRVDRGTPQRGEEGERAEVEVLVQRFESRDLFFIDTNPEVRLAHPELDVEIPVERLLVGRRPVAREAHHVVVDFRQRLALVDVPEALRIGDDSGVYGRLPIDEAEIQPVVTFTRAVPGNLSMYSRSTNLGLNVALWTT